MAKQFLDSIPEALDTISRINYLQDLADYVQALMYEE
jgi:hypothetical protein